MPIDKPDHAFSYKLQVQPDDIDVMGHVNNVVYLRWVQEVATAHWYKIASPEIQQKYLWVVSRHEIDYLRPAMPNEQITGYTWVGEYDGSRFDRFVQLCRDSDGKVLAEAKTTWVLIDATTMRPRNIEQDLLDIL